MNNLFKLTLYGILLIATIGCNGKLLLTRTDLDKDIIIRLNKEHERLAIIQLPFEIEIKNRTLRKKYFCEIRYRYSLYDNSSFLFLFQDDKEISFDGLKEVPAINSVTYSAYSAHYIYKSESTQEQLRPYIDQMLELDQDTLAIKFVDFKNEHEELLKEITKFDSISIRTLKSDKSWDGERIAIPANW